MENSTYREMFAVALDRTKRLGLNTPDIKENDGSVITNGLMSKFPYILRNRVGEIEVEDIAAKCLSINYLLSQDIEEIFNTPCYYTIGYIQLDDGERMFHHNEDDLKSMLEPAAYMPNVVNLHAWLTFSTMEVIDISIATTIQIANGDKPEGRVLVKNPDDLIDFKYMPMIVGDDFLKKTGAVIGVNIN